MQSEVERSAARRILVTVAAIGTYAVFTFGRDWGLDLLGAPERGEGAWFVRTAWFWGWTALPAFVLAALLFGPYRLFSSLGLAANPLRGLAFAFLCTLPMLVPLAVWGTWQPGDLAPTLIGGAVLPGVLEEVVYRGMLFGFLFRFAGWGFFPAALVGALFFGPAHAFQGGSVGEAAGIVAVTALGAAWFAWLYAAWRNNLWVPIGFHVLMNAYWGVFAVSDTALGGPLGNGTRVAVIVLSIILTTWWARRRGWTLPVKARGWRFERPA